MAKEKILVVEDEAITAKDIEATLQDRGYDVCGIASTGEEALQVTEAEQPDLVLMDIVLDGDIDGIEAAEKIRADWDIPVVYLTAHSDGETIRRAKISEPYGYILKPFYDRELHSNIEIALYKNRMERQQREMNERVEKNLHGTISCIGELIRMRDPFLNQNQENVATLSCALAEELGLSADDVEGIRVAALLHAIGLMNVPVDLLRRARSLTGSWLKLYQEYPATGFDLLKSIDFPWPVAQTVLQHRELLDGSGFPNGIKGDAIIKEARIIGLAQAAVSMLSDFDGQEGMTMDEMITEIGKGKELHYDSEVVDACSRLCNEKGFTFGG